MRRNVLLLMAVSAALGVGATPAAAQQPVLRATSAPAWLGVNYDIQWFEVGGTCSPHLMVEGVVPGSPAERAGLRSGDVVVNLDGHDDPALRLPLLVARMTPGDSVRIAVRRGGSTRRVVAIAGRRPDQAPGALLESVAEARRGPLVQLRGDTVVASNVPTSARVGGYWIAGQDGQVAFRTLPARPTVELDRRVATLLDCAGSGSRFVPLRQEADRIQERAESLRVAIARRALERPGQATDAVVLREFLPAIAAAAPGLQPEVFLFRAEDALGTAIRGVAGAELVTMEPELAAYFRGAESGLLVIRVAGGTPAHRAGLRPGDVVVAAAGERVTSLAHLRTLVSGPDAAAQLTVVRQGRRRTISLPRP